MFGIFIAVFIWFMIGLFSFVIVFGNDDGDFHCGGPSLWDESNKKQKAFICIIGGPAYWIGVIVKTIIMSIISSLMFIYKKLGE